MKNIIQICVVFVSLCFSLDSAFGQGALTPPGAPAPTMKTLSQIEPRAPISVVPFSITNPGSYYFTTNVMGIGVITIDADNVTVDLNGFTFGGAPGSGTGFFIPTAHTNLCIRNGNINNHSGYGISAGGAANSRFTDLVIMGNGIGGAQIGEGNLVARCEVRNNTGVGINVGDRCIMRECSVSGSTSHGLSAGQGVLVEDCVLSGNGAHGVNCGAGCNLNRCILMGNTNYGVNGGQGCNILACSAYGNGGLGFFVDKGGAVKDSSVTLNRSYGIWANKGAVISGCIVSSNSSQGLELYENCTIANCTIDGNGARGIDGFPSSTVINCTVTGNTGAGIFVTDGSTVKNCTVKGNGLEGIYVTDRCSVLENTCSANGAVSASAGIRVSGYANVIDGNHLAANTTVGLSLDATSGNNLVIRNAAAGTGFIYSLGSSSNSVGLIEYHTGSGNAITNTSPWANFGL